MDAWLVGAASAAMPWPVSYANSRISLISALQRMRDRGRMPCHPSCPARGSERLRKNRCSEAGRVYLVTFATSRRSPVFAQWDVARVAAGAFSAPELWRDSRLLCWVLMPDHWHGLVELGRDGNLSSLVRRIKGGSARAINRAVTRSGAVWAAGYHEHALRHAERTVDAARYVVLNPVRAGIVARVGDYPFWDAVWLPSESIAAEAAPTQHL